MTTYQHEGAQAAADGSAPRERSIAELTRQLSSEVSLLVRQELELARAELAQKGRHAGLGAGMLGGGAMLALGAFAAITACFILALALVLPAWAAAAIVAGAYGAVAALLALRGRREIQAAGKPLPEQTMESVRDDVEWAKTQAKAGRERA
jgi:Flp pilus assembly protein TadB